MQEGQLFRLNHVASVGDTATNAIGAGAAFILSSLERQPLRSTAFARRILTLESIDTTKTPPW